MLINKRVHGYSSKKKYVIGRGFIDSISSIFNSVKSSVLPALSNVGSYLKTNKDLILKPLIGAVETLGAKALTEEVPEIIKRISQNKSKPLILQNSDTGPDASVLEDPKFKELLQNITNSQYFSSIPVSNIIGSGIKKKTKKTRIRNKKVLKFKNYFLLLK